MLTLGLLLIITVTCFVIVQKYGQELVAFIGMVSSFCLVLCVLTLININSRFQVTIEEYNNLKAQIDAFNESDSCRNISQQNTLNDDVYVMNNTISKHSVMSKSAWVNLWYSEKIGNLEKLYIYGIKE